MASEEDDNTTIKGTFSELGKKYLFADTATRGKNYYKLEIPESGIYDLYIYDDIDYDIEGGAIYTSDFSVLTDSESGEGFWFSANEQGRIGHLELEKGTYYISFYVYQQENMNASFAFTKGKEITGYKVTFPSTMRNVYSEGGYIELDELQTVLTFEDNSTETLKGTGSFWRCLGFSYEITGIDYNNGWEEGLGIGSGTVTVYHTSGEQKEKCASMDFEVKSFEDLATNLELEKITSVKLDGSKSYVFTVEEEDYYDFLLKAQPEKEYDFSLYKKPNNRAMKGIYCYEEEESENMVQAELLYLTPGTYYLNPHGYSGLKAYVVYEDGKKETISCDQNKWKWLFTTDYNLSWDTTGSLWTLKAGIYPVYVKGGGHVENYQIEVKNLSDYPQTGAITELGRQTGMIETQGEVLKYSFTPTEAKKYYFYGVTGMDSDAMLWDSNGLRLTSSLTSNEEFSLSYDLEANETYYLTISFKDKTTGDLAFVINDVAENEEHTHVFGDFVTIKEATCTENGMQEAVCKYCNKKQTKEIQKLEHAFGDYITLYEPTCEEKGMKYRICTRCDEREEQISDPLGHDFGEAVIDKEATTNETGSRSKHCSRCDARTEVTIIPKVDSAYSEAETVANKIATKSESELSELTDTEKESYQGAVEKIVSSTSADNNAGVLKENINIEIHHCSESGRYVERGWNCKLYIQQSKGCRSKCFNG